MEAKSQYPPRQTIWIFNQLQIINKNYIHYLFHIKKPNPQIFTT